MFTTTNNDHLIRSNIWSTQLKETFEEDLMGLRFVNMLSEFPDGDTFNIPSIGQADVQDYREGDVIKYRNFDTGNFTFQITEYKAAATAISEKFKQDSMWSSQLIASFPRKHSRAIAEAMEIDMFAKMNAGQTAANLNAINDANHRFVAGATVNTSYKTLELEDFAKAKYALKKAAVPMSNLIAVIDPASEVYFSTQSGVTNLAQKVPAWENVVSAGMSDSTGMRFLMNIYGFDVYVSNFLPVVGAETINSVSTSAGAVANFFFSAVPEAVPLVGAVRQAPKVDSEFNKDLQRDEYVVTTRWGFKLYRPESLVTVLTDSGANFVQSL